MTLVEMHLSKKKEQTKITERVLKENYDQVWQIVEEEIKNVSRNKKLPKKERREWKKGHTYAFFLYITGLTILFLFKTA